MQKTNNTSKTAAARQKRGTDSGVRPAKHPTDEALSTLAKAIIAKAGMSDAVNAITTHHGSKAHGFSDVVRIGGEPYQVLLREAALWKMTTRAALERIVKAYNDLLTGRLGLAAVRAQMMPFPAEKKKRAAVKAISAKTGKVMSDAIKAGAAALAS